MSFFIMYEELEEWRDIENFPGYQVSNTGYVRSFWKKKHVDKGYGTYRYLSDEPMIMSMSDDGNGYLKLMLYSKITGGRYCRKVHNLVGHAFLPKPADWDTVEYTVDHIKKGPLGKLDNSVWNLQWLSRGDNVRKAYRDGMHDERIARQNKIVSCVDTWLDKEILFGSIKEAAQWLRVPHSTISHAISDYRLVMKRYMFEFLEGEDKLLYDPYFCYDLNY